MKNLKQFQQFYAIEDFAKKHNLTYKRYIDQFDMWITVNCKDNDYLLEILRDYSAKNNYPFFFNEDKNIINFIWERI